LIEEYRRLADEFGFLTVDARRSIDEVQADLCAHVNDYLRKFGNRPPAPETASATPSSSRKD
jgi:hypothetical protein